MNVADHQEKEKKTGKRKAGEERRQTTDFKEVACCPSAVVEGATRQKNSLCEGVLWATGILGKANSHLDPTQTGSVSAPPG